MKIQEIREMMADIAPVIREFTTSIVGPVIDRLDALERRIDELPTTSEPVECDSAADLTMVRDRIFAEMKDIRSAIDAMPGLPDIPSLIDSAISSALIEIPAPRDGKDADEETIVARVSNEVSAGLKDLRDAIEAIQPAPGLPDIAGMVERSVSDARGQDVAQIQAWMDGVDEKLAALPVPRDGKDADPIDMDEVRSMVAEIVEPALAAIPVPQDGKSVSIEDARPVIEDAVSRAVAALPKARDGEPGKDGVGVAGAVIDRDGSLVVTLSNGDTKQLGRVVGRDGAPGDKGAAGRDGIGFDDIDLIEDDRGVVLRFNRGDIVKDFVLPIVVDRGVYRDGAAYIKGSGVTWGGSFWIAQRDTSAKPDTPDSGWRLAVKKGQNGRDAK